VKNLTLKLSFAALVLGLLNHAYVIPLLLIHNQTTDPITVKVLGVQVLPLPFDGIIEVRRSK